MFEHRNEKIYCANGVYIAGDRPQESLGSLQAAREAIDRRKERFRKGFVKWKSEDYQPLMWGQGLMHPLMKWAFVLSEQLN
jgi:hypothetical protein